MKKSTKTMVRLTALAAALLVLVGALGACRTPAENAEYRQYAKQGEANAIAYIEAKYGFTPLVVESEAIEGNAKAVLDMAPAASGMVCVNMEYNQYPFLVAIRGDKETTSGSDNYQRDLIQKDAVAVVTEKLGKTPDGLLVYYGGHADTYFDMENIYGTDGLVSEYYDGTDTFEYLVSHGMGIIAEFTDYDLKSFDPAPLSVDIDGKVRYPDTLLMLYRSEEDWEDGSYLNHTTTSIAAAAQYATPYAPHLAGSGYLAPNGAYTYRDFHVEEAGDALFLQETHEESVSAFLAANTGSAFAAKEATFTGQVPVSAEVLEDVYALHWTMLTAKNVTVISSDYIFAVDGEDAFEIYFPNDIVEDIENRRILTLYYKDGELIGEDMVTDQSPRGGYHYRHIAEQPEADEVHIFLVSLKKA